MLQRIAWVTGATHSWLGDRYTFLVTGEETVGAYLVVEAYCHRAAARPAHPHARG